VLFTIPFKLDFGDLTNEQTAPAIFKMF